MATFYFIFLLVPLVLSHKIGDPCNVEGKNVTGKCLLLKDCPGTKQGNNSTSCDVEGSDPVVCCESAKRAVGEISKEKCKEYGESVYDIVYSFNVNPQPNKVSKCSIVQTTLVVGGEDAKPKEFPHMALLRYEKKDDVEWKCGGILVSDQFVLTAAHCLAEENVIGVRLGELDVSTTTDDAKPEDFTVTEIIPHPGYKYPDRYNDIALLKLDRPVKFNDYIRPGCLQTNREPHNKFIATGWGLTYVGNSNGSNILQKVIIEHFPDDKCIKSFGKERLPKGVLPDLQLCAGGKGDKDTCQGDSGGPLQVYTPDVHCMYNIVGVTSFGKSCGVHRVPAVYTRVSSYIEWLEEKIWG